MRNESTFFFVAIPTIRACAGRHFGSTQNAMQTACFEFYRGGSGDKLSPTLNSKHKFEIYHPLTQKNAWVPLLFVSKNCDVHI